MHGQAVHGVERPPQPRVLPPVRGPQPRKQQQLGRGQGAGRQGWGGGAPGWQLAAA